MNFIRPNLAVCGFHHIRRQEQFQQYGFHAQLQCAAPFDPWLAECVEVKALPFYDAAPIPSGIFWEAQAWLARHWDQGNRILVSCAGGASRSVTMAIVLLSLKAGVTFLSATAEVIEKVPDAYPHPLVLLSASCLCGEPLTLAELRRVYASAQEQPPYPWSEELLKHAVKQMCGS